MVVAAVAVVPNRHFVWPPFVKWIEHNDVLASDACTRHPRGRSFCESVAVRSDGTMMSRDTDEVEKPKRSRMSAHPGLRVWTYKIKASGVPSHHWR
jgi:hypothetical protein